MLKNTSGPKSLDAAPFRKSLVPFIIVVALISAMSLQAPVPSTRASCSVTRREAVTDFVAALQMPDGGFIDRLHLAWNSASMVSCFDAGVVLNRLCTTSEINVEKLVEFVDNSEDGGYSANPWDKLVSMNETGAAVIAFDSISALDDLHDDSLAVWIMDCNREDGGFDTAPSLPNNAICNVYSAVESLLTFRSLFPLDVERTLGYVLDCYNYTSGGFNLNSFGGPGSFLGTYYGVYLLFWLGGFDHVSRPTIIDHIMSYYDSSTGIFGSDLSTTFFSLGALDVLNEVTRVNASKTTLYILSCQSHLEGGFTNSLSDVDNSFNQNLLDCRYAVESLQILGTLGSLNEQFIVEKKPIWTGDDSSPYPFTPLTCPPLEVNIIIVVVVAVLLIFAVVVRKRSVPRKKLKEEDTESSFFVDGESKD